ncbi:ubiquinone biosynthesis protein UbiJ [Colwellia chukchiensis]|uniref:Ubiquinone biosynthesis accessory factor UbiJ n=1 Tax=Colwellia chukchiensis TaxID=641665 RepID=A0A1H7T1E5_9GAMM|nr:SCP2 sterol-binding domain-containing protein [Colwellia chukchiensis]SEL78730.1 ubiquinone biosynthesis protein UbiJ [Colwellia chukchiensis]
MQKVLGEPLLFAQALSAALETLINQLLRYNMQGTRALRPLSGKTLTVQLTELNMPLSFTISHEKVHVTSSDEHYHCCIRTSVSTLLAFNKNQQLTDLIKNDQLDIQGDLKVAQRFAEIAQTLDIDWQSEIAKRIGDMPTYQLGRVGRSLREKINFARTQIQADASEWLVHEQRLLVTAGELAYFSRDVEQVTAKLHALQQRLDALNK